MPGGQHSLAMAMGLGGAPGVSPAHGQAATMAVVSCPNLVRQVALNSDLATQHAIQTVVQQQRLAPQLPSAMTPTVTITQNVPIAGAMGFTQSNMAVSMASMSQTQLQSAHSLTQNLSAPSTSLVSYPICMTIRQFSTSN